MDCTLCYYFDKSQVTGDGDDDVVVGDCDSDAHYQDIEHKNWKISQHTIVSRLSLCES